MAAPTGPWHAERADRRGQTGAHAVLDETKATCGRPCSLVVGAAQVAAEARPRNRVVVRLERQLRPAAEPQSRAGRAGPRRRRTQHLDGRSVDPRAGCFPARNLGNRGEEVPGLIEGEQPALLVDDVRQRQAPAREEVPEREHELEGDEPIDREPQPRRRRIFARRRCAPRSSAQAGTVAPRARSQRSAPSIHGASTKSAHHASMVSWKMPTRIAAAIPS